jgi:predicted enzyme related to lactoylglutathione lyase
MSIDNALASVAVSDLKSAQQWYEKVIGRPPDFTPMPELIEWKFPGGGGLQVYLLRERAGRCSCTLAVTRIDAEVARLRSAGIETGELASGPGVETMMVKDPDGNSIAFAQASNPSMLR